MFSDNFLADSGARKPVQEYAKRARPPPRSCEDWLQLEDINQWPRPTPHEEPDNLDPDSILGSLDDIREDFRTHSPWGAVVLDGVEKRLQSLEDRLAGLADKFMYGPTAPESVAGGLANTTFLTELRDANVLSARRPKTASPTNNDQDGRTLDSLVYPGIGADSTTVPFPGTLEPLQLLNLVTKTTALPNYITKSWHRVFFSDSSCSLLQNTFWYVWLTYFKSKPQPEDVSRLFTAISENFTTLFHILEQKHKDEIFVYLPGCLARAVYSAFCHGFPKSNKIFNSETFLSYVTNLTSEWITGVVSPPGSWRKWPHHLLNPHQSETTEAAVSSSDTLATHTSPLSEKDVMRLSIRDRPRTVRLQTHTRAAGGKRSSRPRSRVKLATNATPEDEEVGIGRGPTFESVWFGLTARSPLLQHYLVTHGLVEETREGGTEGIRPLVGRTQISHLPPPTQSYKEFLKSSKAATKQNYDVFERELAKTEQEIAATRKKHNALLRASDRRAQRLLQHRDQVAIMAERIMNSIACKATPPKPAETKKSPQQKPSK